jgi:hypothetical protein
MLNMMLTDETRQEPRRQDLKGEEMSMRTLRTWLLVPAVALVAGLCSMSGADAQQHRWSQFYEDQWQELDTQRVQPGTQQITMQVGRREGRHNAIRLRVMDEPVFIRSLVVTYGNGTSTEIPVRRLLRPGEATEPLDLEGEERFIRNVTVSFRQDQNFRRASRLQLLGDIVKGQNQAPPPQASRNNFSRDEMPKDWVLFGVEKVSSGGDRDVIRVGREKGRFDKIALRVRGGDVFLRDISIRYGNGETQSFPVNEVIRPDFRTQELRLDKPHHIETIEMVYSSRRSRGGRDQPSVEVWGEYSPNWLRGEGRDPGWMLVGAKSASMIRSDNDVYPVGERFGRFARLRMTAKNSDVEIRSITLTYGNGDSETIPFNRVLRRGQTSQELQLRTRPDGQGRRIESIALQHKSRPSLSGILGGGGLGEGVVELWAHQ